jgi:hypothetical protein
MIDKKTPGLRRLAALSGVAKYTLGGFRPAYGTGFRLAGKTAKGEL